MTVRIGREQILVRPGRDANGPGRPEAFPLGFEVEIGIEDLNSIVTAIGDVDVSFCVRSDRVRSVELKRISPTAADGLHEIAVLGEFDYASVVVSVSDEDLS